MVGRVVRKKAVAAGAGTDHQPYLSVERGLVAGPEALHGFFENIGARQVAKRHGGQEGQGPPKAADAEIQHHKGNDEKIKRCPENGVAEVGENGVKKRVGQPVIQRQK